MCVCFLELLGDLGQAWHKEKRAVFITGLIICCRLYDIFVQACARKVRAHALQKTVQPMTCVRRYLLVRAAICALSPCSCSVVLVFSLLAIHSKSLSYITALSARVSRAGVWDGQDTRVIPG